MSSLCKNLNPENTTKEEFIGYIGTYTNSRTEGIYQFKFNSTSGKFTKPQLAIKALNPNFLAFSPDGNFLYSIGDFNSVQDGTDGCVSAFSLKRQTGEITLLNQVSSKGKGPCHIVIDKTGRYAFISNYGTGNLAVLSIAENGAFSDPIKIIQHSGSSIDPNRQNGPHIHSINIDYQNNYAFAADLGLDKIFIYKFNSDKGTFEANKNMPYVSVISGSGPRHFAFSHCGKYGYVINEMANTITAFNYGSSDGTLFEIQTISTIPSDYLSTTYTSEIQIHPNGKYLYGSNRGHNSIAVFQINQKNGKLDLLEIQPCGGDWPRHFCIDPTGKWLLSGNEQSNQIAVFAIDINTGKLSNTGEIMSVPSPVCIKFSPF